MHLVVPAKKENTFEDGSRKLDKSYGSVPNTDMIWVLLNKNGDQLVGPSKGWH